MGVLGGLHSNKWQDILFLMSDIPLIKLSHVHKGYHEGGIRREVLTDNNAEFHKGGIIVIQGRSGSGKSTLLNLLAGIDLPDRGYISVNDQVITQQDEQQRTLFRRKHLGFVFQFFNLVSTLTVFENIAFPLELNSFHKNEIRHRVEGLLEEFSLEDRIHSFPDQLSGGEQQRVAIARAIVHMPTLILADEPTGNLDLETEKNVLQILKALPGQHDVTVVCATHSKEIADIADRVYSLEQGKLIAL